MQINIPDELAKKIEERVKNSGEFSSVEEYVNYVLTEVIKQSSQTNAIDQASQPGDTPQPQQVYTKDQEQQVKKRLQNLGYLD